MKTEKLIMRIDPERKGFLETKAKNEKRPLSAVVTEALDLFRARDLISNHVRRSLSENMRRFGSDYKAFWSHINAQGKFYGGNPVLQDDEGSSKMRYELEQFVSMETFHLLGKWSERKPEQREQFMQDVVYQREFWLPPDALQPPLFPAEEAGSAKVGTVKAAKVKPEDAPGFIRKPMKETA